MLAFIPSYIFIVPFVAYVALPFFARPELQLTTSYVKHATCTPMDGMQELT